MAVRGHSCVEGHMNMRTNGLIFSLFVSMMTISACGGGALAAHDGGGTGGNQGTGGSQAGTGGSQGSGGDQGGAGGSGGGAVDAPISNPSDASPSNACVNAGGTCKTDGCKTPSDPKLDQSCGGSAAAHCCMPPPDAAAPPFDAPVIDPSGKFACGKTSCDPVTDYCEGDVGGIGGDAYVCRPLPAKCGGHATCACVQSPPCPYCDEKDGAVLLRCPVG
jgi:hypothetical protein